MTSVATHSIQIPSSVSAAGNQGLDTPPIHPRSRVKVISGDHSSICQLIDPRFFNLFTLVNVE